jgi:hypothetical protein
MKQFRLGIAAVVALGVAGFATGAATAAPITVDRLARHADSGVVQVQYDPHSNPYWRAKRWRERSDRREERWRERSDRRAERWREHSTKREWRWRREHVHRAQRREERRHY